MTENGKTSALFTCMTCGAFWEDVKTARKYAYNHAKKLEHNVTGEIGTMYHYNFKK